MERERLFFFSDGVIAIIITIMVLELKIPKEPEIAALVALWPVFISYILSFINIAIFWNNHHHLLFTLKTVKAHVLWGNMNFLFWLSLIPFATGWMGENGFAPLPTALYGFVLFAVSASYSLLKASITETHDPSKEVSKAVKQNYRPYLALAAYAVATPLALYSPLLAGGIFVVVAAFWFIPDKDIENELEKEVEVKEEKTA